VDAALRRVTVPSDGTTAARVAAAGRLDAAGVRPVELGLRLPSLDDVFLALTGRATTRTATGPDADADADDAGDPGPAWAAPGAPTRRRASTLADIAAVTGRDVKRMLRTPQLLFFATVQPVLFVLGLSAVFGPLVERITGGRYIDFLMPGVLVMNLILAAGSTGIGLAEDMKAGIIDRFRSLPMSRAAVLAGRTIADLVRNAAASVLIVAAGFALGYRPHASVGALVAALAVALLFAYACTWVFAAIGLVVKDPQTAQFAGFAPVLPLVYLSGAWVPVATMAPAVRGFARHQPVNVTIEAVRALAGGAGGGAGAIAQSLAWSAALVVVFVTLAVRRYVR
jgi:ABC-2 type transport system permease protein/oleandomycin transport system permease protein